MYIPNANEPLFYKIMSTEEDYNRELILKKLKEKLYRMYSQGMIFNTNNLYDAIAEEGVDPLSLNYEERKYLNLI